LHHVPSCCRLAQGRLVHRAARVVPRRVGHVGALPVVAAGDADVPRHTDITICSLDDPEQVPPRDHNRAATKLSWVKLADGLPVYPGARAAD
jgi:hypothetical protein